MRACLESSTCHWSGFTLIKERWNVFNDPWSVIQWSTECYSMIHRVLTIFKPPQSTTNKNLHRNISTCTSSECMHVNPILEHFTLTARTPLYVFVRLVYVLKIKKKISQKYSREQSIKHPTSVPTFIRGFWRLKEKKKMTRLCGKTMSIFWFVSHW